MIKKYVVQYYKINNYKKIININDDDYIANEIYNFLLSYHYNIVNIDDIIIYFMSIKNMINFKNYKFNYNNYSNALDNCLFGPLSSDFKMPLFDILMIHNDVYKNLNIIKFKNTNEIKQFLNNENNFNIECCVCYEKYYILIQNKNCIHNICCACYANIEKHTNNKKINCPYCRSTFEKTDIYYNYLNINIMKSFDKDFHFCNNNINFKNISKLINIYIYLSRQNIILLLEKFGFKF